MLCSFCWTHDFSRPFQLHFHFHHAPIVVRFTIRWSSLVQLGVLFTSDGAELTMRWELGEFVEGGESDGAELTKRCRTWWVRGRRGIRRCRTNKEMRTWWVRGRRGRGSLVLCSRWRMVGLFGHSTVNQHPTSAPSIGCSLDEPSTELIFGFTLVTNSVGNRYNI
jgi:hypothetical protein